MHRPAAAHASHYRDAKFRCELDNPHTPKAALSQSCERLRRILNAYEHMMCNLWIKLLLKGSSHTVPFGELCSPHP